MKKKTFCPFCGATEIIPIMYGYPSPIMFDAADRGEIELGGCEFNIEHDPMYKCKKCDKKWSYFTLPSKHITKVRYKEWDCGLGLLEWAKSYVYEIYPDGKMVKYSYRGTSRKYQQRVEIRLKHTEIAAVLQSVVKAIDAYYDNAYMSVIDGRAYQLQVTYNDNEKEIIEGSAGEGSPIDSVFEAIKNYWE